MKKIASLVSGAIGRDEVLKAGRAMRILRQWPEIVGPHLAPKSAPERFDHGTVWVAVSGAAWAQELRMSKGQILAKLRNLCGEPDLFTDVRFGVRTLPEAPEAEAKSNEDDKEAYRKSLEGLSIQEIRERRRQSYE